MAIDTGLQELKRRLSPRLLAIPGVSGVGIQDGKLAVYLAEDSDAVRQQAQDIIESEAKDQQVVYTVTGAFRRQA
jgi:hypothetical protein